MGTVKVSIYPVVVGIKCGEGRLVPLPPALPPHPRAFPHGSLPAWTPGMETQGHLFSCSRFWLCSGDTLLCADGLSIVPIYYISEVAQSCPTLCDPMDCCLPGFSVHGIFQARVLEWVAISFSRGSSWPRDRTCRQTLYPLSHQGSPMYYIVRK